MIDEQDAATLARVPGERAYRTTKRWSADGTPVMVAIDLVPSRATSAPEDPSQSVLCLTRELTGEDTDWLCAWPSATAMPAAIAALFARREGEPVLQLDQVGVNRRGTRVFVAHEYHVPGPLKYGLIRTIRH
jgi:GntR family transcriptional regulator